MIISVIGEAITEIMIEHKVFVVLYMVTTTVALIAVVINAKMRKVARDMVAKEYNIHLGITSWRFERSDNEIIKSLQEDISTLKLENSALKTSKMWLATIVALFMVIIVMIFWGKRIIDAIGSMLRGARNNEQQENQNHE